MRLRLGTLVLSLAALAGSPGHGAEPQSLPFKPSPVPGGVAVVALPAKATAPAVTYRGEPVITRRSSQGWVAVVGIPLSAKPGEQALEVDGRGVPFAIKAKHYPEQRVHVEDQRKVTPNAEDEARIAREQVLMAPVWKAWPEALIPSLSFRQPTPGALTASFGMRRIFNGVPRSPHSGLDIRSPQGQAVRAPAPGRVVLTGDFFYSGNAVFIAHGEGVVSLLCHLSKITVKEGQVLQAGDVVGEVGKTGRATGPHLHWSLSLNNARVDPRIFLGGHP
ncbi:MAG: peptidoglycan DD-metalloendopeptidase family protein [Geothrix sp.]|uniref:M23 family metallopeptidase n=1 Tax=Geothrix sp. TaxID=1962974 RepID=UPI00179F5EFC|nr:M23 family metallopeptidase [Geothrix sp.]NWJ40807.1 peptidoglycan DD-metalloendopeptidase family protein [Geothrix sp.]WIL21191.1 MAG: peptidoglycan DD-metalloendopeptidase family protein [Geothrix sp.]